MVHKQADESDLRPVEEYQQHRKKTTRKTEKWQCRLKSDKEENSTRWDVERQQPKTESTK